MLPLFSQSEHGYQVYPLEIQHNGYLDSMITTTPKLRDMLTLKEMQMEPLYHMTYHTILSLLFGSSFSNLQFILEELFWDSLP